jgi:hypothetical protein
MMVMVSAVVMVAMVSIAVPLARAVLLAHFDDFEVGLDVVIAPIAGVEVGGLRLDDRGADSSEYQREHGQNEDGADDHGASFEFACGKVPIWLPHMERQWNSGESALTVASLSWC